MIVIGGGATGVGTALDAASRGYRVALLEQHDFGKGTSSRSTKLAHGGVRYLQQGHLSLVREALHERGLMRANAAHWVRPLPTIVPLYKWWEPSYYWLGLKAYDAMSGSLSLGPSTYLTKEETIAELPTISPRGLRGGVRYFDAHFDDARLLVALAQTAVAYGAVCLNYCRVEALKREGSKIRGVTATDLETGDSFDLDAAVVINAAGPFADSIREMDAPNSLPWIVPSQGVHIVLERQFLPSDAALIVPRTSDGRVIFAIPWHTHILVGTTDTPLAKSTLEPRPQHEEIEFLLKTIGDYLQFRPTWSDIRAIFTGVRPLLRANGAKTTSELSREHEVRISDSGLVSILGGKWTIYRKMAEDCVDRAAQVGGLAAAPCLTAGIEIGYGDASSVTPQLRTMYGDNAARVKALVEARQEYLRPLSDSLPFVQGEVVWAARHEMARSIEDVLARRLRMLFLDAEAAVAAAPTVAKILSQELGHDESWRARQLAEFNELASLYSAKRFT